MASLIQTPAESLPMTQVELDIMAKLVSHFGASIKRELSPTMILQSIRGWETTTKPDIRLAETIECIQKILDYRSSSNCSHLTYLPSANVDTMVTNWASEIYGQDSQGHYIWCEKISGIKADELLKSFSDEQMKCYRGVMMEAAELHKGTASKPLHKSGEKAVESDDDLTPTLDPSKVSKIYKHIYIMDLSGLSLSHFSSSVRRVVQNVIIEMGNLYPESVCKMIFINSPFAFRAIWSMISPFLHKVTIEKTKIVGSGSAIIKELEKCGVPLNQIPKFCGGGHEGVTIKSLIENWRKEEVDSVSVSGLEGEVEKLEVS